MKRIERAELKEKERINLMFSKQHIREFNKLSASQQKEMVNEMEKKFLGYQKEREKIHDELIKSYQRNGYDFDLYKYLFQKKKDEEIELTFKFFPVSFGLGKQ
jgi:paraquat-inducible protein B